MAEIWNLSAICRCCHSDGEFKSLRAPYLYQNEIEIYSSMLQETFDVQMNPPPLDWSYSICEGCICQLRAAARFKRQVLVCEQKFHEYCRNEQFPESSHIKVEFETTENDNNPDNKITIDIHNEKKMDIKWNDSDSDDNGAFDNVKVEDDSLKEDGCVTKVEIKSPKKEVKRNKAATKKRKNVKSKNDSLKEDGCVTKVEIKSPKKEVKRNKASTKKGKNVKSKKNDSLKDDGCVPKIEIKSPKKEVEKKGATKKEKNVRSKRVKRSGTPVKTDPALVVIVNTAEGVLYSCKLCEGVYNTKILLIQHLRENHMTHTYKCQMCGEVFQKKALLLHHKRTGTKCRPFPCSYCPKRFLTSYYLRYHETSHSDLKMFKCDHCGKDFKHKTILSKHILWHNGLMKKHMCDICGLMCNDQVNLKKHIMTVHEKIRNFVCDICFKHFSAKKHITVHMRRHTGERPFVCELCNKGFIDFTTMKKHKETHGVTIRNYVCKVCEEVFNHRGKFRIHLRKHKGDLPYKCHLCCKDFSCKYSLNRHVELHSGLRPHVCQVCQATFSHKTQLDRHVRNVHDPNKLGKLKTKCSFCKKFFTDIEKHEKKHTTRPHECHLCNKRYPEKNTLNRHMKHTHLNIKPHVCNTCGKKYTKIYSLKRHEMKAHKVVPKIEQADLEFVMPAFGVKNDGNDSLSP